jgi:hypothetical protein
VVFADRSWQSRDVDGATLRILQGGAAVAKLGFRPPVLRRTTVHGHSATAWSPTGSARSRCLSWVEGQAGLQVCSYGMRVAPLPLAELHRVADGLRPPPGWAGNGGP